MSLVKAYKATFILSIILLISLILNFYLLVDKFKVAETNLELKKNKEYLDKELRDAKDEINKYKGLSAGLDTIIKQANLSIILKESKIKDLISLNELNGDENQKMLLEISNMKEKYLNTIDSLLVERRINSKLNNTINSLETKISNLNKKLGAAEQLPIENIEVNPQKENALGSTNQTALAKKATEVQICYKIQPNKATPSGKKVIFIRIFDPFGHFLNDKSIGKGEFFHPDYKINVPYTLTDTIEYKNEALEICTKWKNPENYVSGIYLVELYTEREAIGTTTFTLR
jgi:hypothetical protein